jgi:hypothetical protein
MQVGPGRINLLSLAAAPQLAAPTGGSDGWYAIGHVRGHAIENYSSFADFVGALSADLAGTTTVLGLAADGKYDASGNTFNAQHAAVLISD